MAAYSLSSKAAFEYDTLEVLHHRFTKNDSWLDESRQNPRPNTVTNAGNRV